MIVIAHRGARAFAPENTLEAFAKAAEMRADAVELDTQLSADGVPVLWHDDTLMRCSDVAVRFPQRARLGVDGFTLEELKQLDAGSWFARQLDLPSDQRQPFLATLGDAEASRWISGRERKHHASGEIRIPTLLEGLERCRGLGLQVHVEMKSIPRMWKDLPEKVLTDIDRLGMRSQVVVSSFNHQHLARLRSLAEDIELAVLTHDRLFDPERYLSGLGARWYAVGCYGPYDTLGLGSKSGHLDTPMIHRLGEAGYKVSAWTENDAGRMQGLIEAGVGGIFTDFPNRLRAVIDGEESEP